MSQVLAKPVRRSPWAAAATLLLGFVYGVSPIDLIPDIIPLLGWSDDVGVFFIALFVAWRFWRGKRARST